MTVDSTGDAAPGRRSPDGAGGAAPGSDMPDADGWPADTRKFDIRSTAETPAGLAAELPVTATELGVIDGGAGNLGQFCCVLLDTPIKHRFGDSDPARYEREYCDRDDEGHFFRVHIVVVGTRRPEDALFPGARGVRVDVAYVIDLSLEDDVVLDPAKIDWVGAALVDVTTVDQDIAGDQEIAGGRVAAPDEVEAPPQDTPTQQSATRTGPVADQVRPDQIPGDPPRAAPAPADSAEARSSEWFREQIDGHIDTLSRLVGQIAVSEVPHPTELVKGQPASTDAPQYVLDGSQLWYHTLHPQKGFIWRTTTNPDELVYWCVDDVARGLAWRWTRRVPTYRKMSPAMAQRTIWAPYWQLLMTALDTNWGAYTGRNVRSLL